VSCFSTGTEPDEAAWESANNRSWLSMKKLTMSPYM
jgi:hypothetical protein